ncbi:GNAT family N-acetyltransferase [Vannielia litorea]|uniref:GNAT family N-acetyltransferase n=1 Tax=Vannielia TaxID=2813041 RepID=UPI001C98905D|nr:GNAT family protein [Vannielia litorea]MBY6047044.1 GNAT family N-acetyltransferase [Vannielia litorea]MBY6074458.1 GNAT family N-acetyltransferase [Vannielia litorea]MBY6153036.1 GNAT family N-acetyltransferase [Vannielia litorea]
MQQDRISGQPVITAERVTLRPLQQSDAGLITLYASDERVARATRHLPHPLPPGTAEGFIRGSHAENRREDVWAIDGTAAGMGELVGIVALSRMEPEKGREQSEIRYWVAPAMWNTGLASEAVAAMVEANPQGSHTMFAEVFQDNPASARVLTNAGFEYLGDAEAYSVSRGGTVPTWTYLKKLA